MHRSHFFCFSSICWFIALLCLPLVARPAHAQTLTTLYTFTDGCYGGDNPVGSLAIDPQGNVYGTWEGPRRCRHTGGGGGVFEVTPSGTETTLYYFSLKTGLRALAGPILDSSGNLYGTTLEGGLHGGGTVFEVTPFGMETVLHSFSKHPGTKKKPADGYYPAASLIFDSQGNLYGTTTCGGNYQCSRGQGGGCGAVFQLTPSGTEALLYKFNGGSDGAFPYAPVIFDQNGNLYGTTPRGGAFDCGTVFKVTPPDTESVLYAFTCGADGANPGGGLVMDEQGNLYGTTAEGGLLDCDNGFGCGVIFELTPSETLNVLHTFTGGNDGSFPNGPLVLDSQGNLYGTTYDGGAYGVGTVFALTP